MYSRIWAIEMYRKFLLIGARGGGANVQMVEKYASPFVMSLENGENSALKAIKEAFWGEPRAAALSDRLELADWYMSCNLVNRRLGKKGEFRLWITGLLPRQGLDCTQNQLQLSAMHAPLVETGKKAPFPQAGGEDENGHVDNLDELPLF